MKDYLVTVEVDGLNNPITSIVRLNDNLTDEEIEEECKEEAFDKISWNWEELNIKCTKTRYGDIINEYNIEE